MVTVYTSPSCTSCRKAKAWLEEHHIPYKERNINSKPLSIDEIKNILRYTEYGTEEIISTKSKVYQNLSYDINDLPLDALYKFIQQHPSIMKRPILIDDKRMQVGFNEEEIRSFLPRKVRSFLFQELQQAINE